MKTTPLAEGKCFRPLLMRIHAQLTQNKDKGLSELKYWWHDDNANNSKEINHVVASI
jgi:hypothetical protein